MNTPKSILLAVLGIAVTALVYYNLPREAAPAKGGSDEDRRSASASAAGDAGTRHAGGGITRPAPSEDEVPGGRDGTFTSAPVREAGALIDPQRETPLLTTGEKAGARVTVGERTSEPLNPNQFGEFPRVYILPSQAVSVRVVFPGAAAGAQVVAQVEDGGKFADGKPVAVLKLDEKREAAFEFIAGAEPGAYRIAVRHGPDWKYVQLWAGAGAGAGSEK